MEDLKVPSLNIQNVKMANNNSQFNRGDGIVKSYIAYCKEVETMPLSNTQKQSLINKLYSMFEKKLSYDAQYVPVTVAGPARYNSSKMSAYADKSMEISSQIVDWFNSVKEQLKYSSRVKGYGSDADKQEKIQSEIDWLRKCERDNWLYAIPNSLIKLSALDKDVFLREFERYNVLLKFRKNTNVYKVYEHIKNGGNVVNSIDNFKVDFENADYKVVLKNERVFIYFTLKPKQQLIYALKKRGYWWNSNENAWSSYLKRYDRNWVTAISENYSKYL